MLDAVTSWLQVAGVVLVVVCAGVVVAALAGGLLGVGLGVGAAGVACLVAAWALGVVDRALHRRPGSAGVDELGRRRAA